MVRVVVLIALAGCGQASYIELDIDDQLADGSGTLVVGETETITDVETDELRFELFRVKQEVEPIASRSFALEPAVDRFPMKVLMEPVADTPNPVSVRILASWRDVVVAGSGLEIDWQPGVVSVVAVQLESVP